MDPSSGQNLQEMSSDSLGNMLVGSKPQQDRKPRPHPEQALKCPRCDSTNTKFCYYNNYSLSQPRYFCKACRRYWTKGGTLRNVPVGGGCRRNKRSSSSSSTSSSSSSSKLRAQDNSITPNPNPLIAHLQPSLAYDSNDLSLAFARLQKQSCGQLGFDDHDHHLSILGNPVTGSHCDDHHNQILGINNLGINNNGGGSGFLDALRNGFLESQNHSNMYYGFGNGNGNNNMENGGVSGGDQNIGQIPYHDDHQEMINNNNGTTTAVTVTTIKQELGHGMRSSSDHHDHQNRVLWGCPWQLNGSSDNQYHGSMGDIDHTAGRESWNGLASSWHGLLNSTPLM